MSLNITEIGSHSHCYNKTKNLTQKMNRTHLVALLASASLAFDVHGDDHNKPELSPLNVVGSNADAPTLSSGMKTSLALEDTPKSITIVSGEQIKYQGLKSVGDIIDYTPGVNNSQGEGHRDAAVIRGMRTTQDFYRDGIRDDVQYYRPLYNIEQIEVIRGSDALLSGFGGSYGIINRVTKEAQFGESFNSLAASVDTFGELNFQLDNNFEFSGNRAFRINMFGENLENHRDFYYGDSFGVNPTMKLSIGESTLDLSYEFLNQERFIDRGIPTGTDGRPVESLKEYVFADSTDNFSTHEAHIVRAIYNHELNDKFSGRLLASYSDHDKLYSNVYVSGFFSSATQGFTTVDLPIELDGYVDTTKRKSAIFSYEVVGEFETGSLIHNIIVGTEYVDIANDNDRYNADFDPTTDGSEDEAVFALSRSYLKGGFGTGSIGDTDILTSISNNYTSDQKDETFADVSILSFYLKDEINLSNSLDLILGARFDKFEYDVYGTTTATDSDDTISPVFGLVFDLSDNTSLYASYSEAYQPKSGDQYASISTTNAKLDPNTFENLEAGIKWNFSNNLSLAASIFQIEANKPATDDGGETSYMEKSDTTGYEIQLQGLLTENWFMSAGYTSLDAQDETGSRLREAPEDMFSIWNNFMISDRLSANLGVIYQGESQIGSSSTPVLPDYTRVDVGAVFALSENTLLQVNIENLTDELYFPTSHSTHQATVGAPVHATFGITSSF